MNRLQVHSTGRASAKLYSTLKREILSGRIAGGDYLPTTRELCAKHDLHMETVCRALRRLAQDGLVLGELRRGYRVQARANDPERGCPLAFVLGFPPSQHDTFDRRLMAAVQVAGAARGRSVVAVGRGGRSAAEVVEELLGHRAWGVMLNAADAGLVEEVARAGLPAVLVGYWLPDLDVDAVVQDNFGGGLSAAEHLAARGHTRIGWLGFAAAEQDTSPHVVERFCGAAGGLIRAGRELLPGLRVEVPMDDPAAALAGARRLLARPPEERPTAILAPWLPLTVAVVRVAAEAGLAPGRDFELVGWINEEAYEAEYAPLFGSGPAAPAVVWSLARMVETAMARLAERRANPGMPTMQLRVPARMRFAEKTGS